MRHLGVSMSSQRNPELLRPKILANTISNELTECNICFFKLFIVDYNPFQYIAMLFSNF